MTGYEFVECRALGHSWDQIPSTRRPPWGYLLTFRCTRCTTTREDVIDLTGGLSTRRYVKPDGYAIRSGDNDPPTRADWRRRLIDKHKRLATEPEKKKTRRKR